MCGQGASSLVSRSKYSRTYSSRDCLLTGRSGRFMTGIGASLLEIVGAMGPLEETSSANFSNFASERWSESAAFPRFFGKQASKALIAVHDCPRMHIGLRE